MNNPTEKDSALTPRQRAIQKFNARFNFDFPDGTGRSDVCSGETLRLMEKYATACWADDLARELRESLQ